MLSGQILESVDFKGKVFNGSVEISDAEINGTATISGDIKGVGNNNITISFNDVKLSLNDDTEPTSITVTGKDINVVVTSDGNITQKTEVFEISGTYEDGLFTGSIVATIKGSVANPVLIVEAEAYLQEHVNLLPESYIQRTYTNNTSNVIQLLTSYNSKTKGENVSLPYYINNFKVEFVKNDNNQMVANISGNIISDIFKPENYDDAWQANYVIDERELAININPTTGYITKTTFILPLEPSDTTNELITTGLSCTIEGNMLHNNVIVTLDNIDSFVGAYAVPFDLDVTLDKSEFKTICPEDGTDCFAIEGVDEFDKVRVYLSENKHEMID
jgi:hypothetical protein